MARFTIKCSSSSGISPSVLPVPDILNSRQAWEYAPASSPAVDAYHVRRWNRIIRRSSNLCGEARMQTTVASQIRPISHSKRDVSWLEACFDKGVDLFQLRAYWHYIISPGHRVNCDAWRSCWAAMVSWLAAVGSYATAFSLLAYFSGNSRYSQHKFLSASFRH